MPYLLLVNIILFEPSETLAPLPRKDLRAVHILKVLRLNPGDVFSAGLIDGPRGQATLVTITDDALTLSFVWGEEPPPLDPITLLIGLPRPQTARKILHEATSLGVEALHFVRTELGEASYASSVLWSSNEWRRHLIDGAQQAFCTRLPRVVHSRWLSQALAKLPPESCRLALDNYEASIALSKVDAKAPAVLAIGPERGWTDRERQSLRDAGFELVHLGRRILRTETACVAGITLLKARLGLI
ncbi:MAG TPA: 16S rRNA (uracil(1498)-N(3))-methyltransferase [Dehalococcoidia bacterium]|nr:16S rRNA (uracil(1498)-N(3))-methyltransferase [Dehalococcoidia bacterium]